MSVHVFHGQFGFAAPMDRRTAGYRPGVFSARAADFGRQLAIFTDLRGGERVTIWDGAGAVLRAVVWQRHFGTRTDVTCVVVPSDPREGWMEMLEWRHHDGAWHAIGRANWVGGAPPEAALDALRGAGVI